jgi:hypothetical protein
MFLAALALAGAITVAAQGQPPQPAGAGVTMAKTWTDDDLDKLMKEIGGTQGAMRKAIDGQNAELLKTNADKLEELFEQVDDFWSSRNVKEAADIADDAAERMRKTSRKPRNTPSCYREPARAATGSIATRARTGSTGLNPDLGRSAGRQAGPVRAYRPPAPTC